MTSVLIWLLVFILGFFFGYGITAFMHDWLPND